MKKLLLNFWRFLNSILLQILLSVVGYNTWKLALELGGKTYSSSGYDTLTSKSSINVTAGFDGGAIAMGLITSMCIFGVVWLQINKHKP